MNATLREVTYLNQTRKKNGFMEKSTDERIEELYDMVQALRNKIGVFQPLVQQPPGD